MTRDSSDPPSMHSRPDLGVLSGMFPRAPTLPELFESARKQATQIAALLGERDQSESRDRANTRAVAKLELHVSNEIGKVNTALEQVRGSLQGIERAFSEYRLEQAKAAVPEAEKRGASNAKLAGLLAMASLLGAGLISLLWHFIGHVSP